MAGIRPAPRKRQQCNADKVNRLPLRAAATPPKHIRDPAVSRTQARRTDVKLAALPTMGSLRRIPFSAGSNVTQRTQSIVTPRDGL